MSILANRENSIPYSEGVRQIIVENFASGIVESDSRLRPETCWLSSHSALN
jgi:hypothetical protein